MTKLDALSNTRKTLKWETSMPILGVTRQQPTNASHHKASGGNSPADKLLPFGIKPTVNHTSTCETEHTVEKWSTVLENPVFSNLSSVSRLYLRLLIRHYNAIVERD